MFHLILHVWYKSGVTQHHYFWDYARLNEKVEQVRRSDRVERYEIEDRVNNKKVKSWES